MIQILILGGGIPPLRGKRPIVSCHVTLALAKEILRMRRRLIRIRVLQGDLLLLIKHVGLYCSTGKYVHGERAKHIELCFRFKRDIIVKNVIIMKYDESLYQQTYQFNKAMEKRSSKYLKSYQVYGNNGMKGKYSDIYSIFNIVRERKKMDTCHHYVAWRVRKTYIFMNEIFGCVMVLISFLSNLFMYTSMLLCIFLRLVHDYMQL